MASLTVGSLFSGIGGLDLGLERAGHRVLWHSEIDGYACRVLKKHWPHVPNIGDVKKVNWSEVPHVDIIAGGYPCQPFSTAGKRKGKEDPRHLWPYVFDAIRALRPRYALMENVRGHLSLGFGDVLADLASSGYSAEWQIIPASALRASHRRDRLFIVAYPNRERSHREEVNSTEGRQSSFSESAGCSQEIAHSDGDSATERGERTSIEGESLSGRNDGRGSRSDDRQIGIRGARKNPGTLAYSTSRRLEEREPESQASKELSLGSHEAGAVADAEVFFGDGGISGDGAKFSEDYPGLSDFLASRGTSSEAHFANWETEPDVGRVAHGIPARVDRLRGLGNAVVPQVAEVVGRLIARHADN